MKRVAFQLFLIKSFMRSFRTSFVSVGNTPRLPIEFLFLVFQIAHVVIAIRIRSLSESVEKSFSNDIELEPLMSPREMFGQGLSVVLFHMRFVVSHAQFCPLFSHSSHKCFSVSVTSMSLVSLQNKQCALSLYPGESGHPGL